MPLTENLRAQIAATIAANDVVLFMKGTRRSPSCGFSARVVALLDDLVPEFTTVDVLADAALRDGIKEFSEWPTIPQLYVRGKFVGGADIVAEMAESGELETVLGVKLVTSDPPRLTMTDAAADAFRGALADAGSDVLRFAISPRFDYDLFLGPKESRDIVVEAGGLTLHLDSATARRAGGTTIDFVQSAGGAGFKITNPNEPAKVQQMSVSELAGLLRSGADVHVFDVRTDRERTIAKIEGTIHFDEAGRELLDSLDRGARIVFQCHHGGRSQSAAESALAQGFRNIHNLRGGIDAWSIEVDPSLPRY